MDWAASDSTQVGFLKGWAASDSTQVGFLKGWLNRVKEFNEKTDENKYNVNC